jgi:Uma2 family endonuclease
MSNRPTADDLLDALPVQGEWTEAMYLALTDHSNRRLEFTDGYLEVLPMPTDEHQAMLEFLYRALDYFLRPRGGRARTAGLRVAIRRGKIREPDVVAIKDLNDPRRSSQMWTGADLAIEVVSPDGWDRDWVDKVHDYAEGNIPEYWIVEPKDETITVFILSDGHYVKNGTFGRGQEVVSVMLPGFSVKVAEVFDAD